MENQTRNWVTAVFSLARPDGWSFIMGCTGISSRIPLDEKWCSLNDASHLYCKVFMAGYSAGTVDPFWDYWLIHGLCADSENPDLMCPFKDVVAVFGREAVEKILVRCIPRYAEYRSPEPVVEPVSVPMPGAGQKQPTIKDVKGERLS